MNLAEATRATGVGVRSQCPTCKRADGDYVRLEDYIEVRDALRMTREALVNELPEGESSLKWKAVLRWSREALPQ